MSAIGIDPTASAGPAEDPGKVRPRPRTKVPSEGADGVFSQTWFPLCRSEEVGAGQVIGCAFLGGKVVVYRGADARVRVLSAYCVHMGADLQLGTVVGNELRCRFHQWQYGDGGRCTRTGVGTAPPPGARQFEFPAVERWGLIWAFNGETPLWHLPALDCPDDDLLIVSRDSAITTCEPFMLTANAFDWQHFGLLHDFHSTEPMDAGSIRWDSYSCGFEFRGKHWQGEDTHYRIEIFGTNIYVQQGTLNGRWYAMILPMGLEKPGKSRTYLQLLMPKGDGSPAALLQARYAAEALADMEMRFIDQDTEILNTIHFGPGHMVADDATFTRFIRYVKQYPRANPARLYLE